MPRPEKHILVCTQERPEDHPKGCCHRVGGLDIANAFAKEFEERKLWGKFKLNKTSCLGVCEHSPSALVYPEGVMYGNLTTEDVTTIIDQHLLNDEPVDRLKVPEDVWS